MNVLEVVEKFEKDTEAKVVYLTKSGSKLYGTDTPTSDTDYKGVFVPSRLSVTLKKDLPFFVNDSNTSKEKNGVDDIDFTVHSIYEFFNQLVRSETGGVDLLFSMWREDTIVFEDKEFTDLMKKNYELFLNKHMKSFIGYALGQTKKFGIKGARYDELDRFVTWLRAMNEQVVVKNAKLGDYTEDIRKHIEIEQYKYIKFMMAPGPRGNSTQKEIEYLTVLGKMFAGAITFEFALERIELLYGQFGNRTKTVAQTLSKTDFKALSHSLRIAREVVELLETGFIKFPLKDADELREIKNGNADVEETIEKVQVALERVDQLLEVSELPKEPDEKEVEDLLLHLLLTKG